jgi:hypothetical protein
MGTAQAFVKLFADLPNWADEQLAVRKTVVSVSKVIVANWT